MKRLLVFICLVGPAILMGQERNIPINISLFNESTSIPFTRFVNKPLHPGLQVGTEFNYKANGKARLFQTLNLGYFYHQHLFQGIGLNSELGYEYRLKSGWALSGLFGVGYMRTFGTAEEFTFSEGQYQKDTEKGNSRIYPSLSLDVGYFLKRAERNSPKVFIRYQSWIEYPYSPGFIPAMTHTNVHIGAKIFIQTKVQKND